MAGYGAYIAATNNTFDNTHYSFQLIGIRMRSVVVIMLTLLMIGKVELKILLSTLLCIHIGICIRFTTLYKQMT